MELKNGKLGAMQILDELRLYLTSDSTFDVQTLVDRTTNMDPQPVKIINVQMQMSVPTANPSRSTPRYPPGFYDLQLAKQDQPTASVSRQSPLYSDNRQNNQYLPKPIVSHPAALYYANRNINQYLEMLAPAYSESPEFATRSQVGGLQHDQNVYRQPAEQYSRCNGKKKPVTPPIRSSNSYFRDETGCEYRERQKLKTAKAKKIEAAIQQQSNRSHRSRDVAFREIVDQVESISARKLHELQFANSNDGHESHATSSGIGHAGQGDLQRGSSYLQAKMVKESTPHQTISSRSVCQPAAPMQPDCHQQVQTGNLSYAEVAKTQGHSLQQVFNNDNSSSSPGSSCASPVMFGGPTDTNDSAEINSIIDTWLDSPEPQGSLQTRTDWLLQVLGHESPSNGIEHAGQDDLQRGSRYLQAEISSRAVGLPAAPMQPDSHQQAQTGNFSYGEVAKTEGHSLQQVFNNDNSSSNLCSSGASLVMSSNPTDTNDATETTGSIETIWSDSPESVDSLLARLWDLLLQTKDIKYPNSENWKEIIELYKYCKAILKRVQRLVDYSASTNQSSEGTPSFAMSSEGKNTVKSYHDEVEWGTPSAPFSTSKHFFYFTSKMEFIETLLLFYCEVGLDDEGNSTEEGQTQKKSNEDEKSNKEEKELEPEVEVEPKPDDDPKYEQLPYPINNFRVAWNERNLLDLSANLMRNSSRLPARIPPGVSGYFANRSQMSRSEGGIPPPHTTICCSQANCGFKESVFD